MPIKKVIKELPSQILQRRMSKIKLEDMSKEDLIKYADFLLETYHKTFNQVRVDYLKYRLNVQETDPVVTMFFETVEEEEGNG
jgi:hypothetical protein